MPTTLYRDTGYALTHLIEDIKHGNIALPDIQRPFVWSATKIRDLFDSMYRGYPVGTLMFWETGAETGTRQVGGGSSDRVAKLLIVDGQQRLTALFAVITGREVINKSFESRRIRIAFNPRDETFDVTDAAIERSPEYIPDITTLWDGSYKSTVRDFLEKLDGSRDSKMTREEQDALEERIDRVRDLRDFRFQVIELNANANEEQVADIFVRINSEGVKLNQADFILTLMSVHWEQGRRELEAFCRSAVDPAHKGASSRNPYLDPRPDQLLRAAVGLAFRRGRLQNVYSILRGKDLETGKVSDARRDEQFARLKDAQAQVVNLTNWHEFLKCLAAAGFRSGRMISSVNAIIYSYILWLIGRCYFGIDIKTLRGVIARWFFMAHTTGRYTTSPESQIETDLGRIGHLAATEGQAFIVELDRIVRSNFTGDYWEISLPSRLDTSSSRSPALFAYWAVLNILDAELLFSDMRIRDLGDPSVTAKRAVERHHLFPKAHLAKQGFKGTKQTNAIANMAFLDWPDNASISAENPAVYWPEMADLLGAERQKKHSYWHALPVGWSDLEYETFLEKRRLLMARVVKDGFERLWEGKPHQQSAVTLADLLSLEESQTLEFKCSARWNVHAGKPDKKMEHVIVKTICGLLNAEGGTLLIGVDDDANVVGLANDFSTLGKKQDRDGYELFLRQLLDSTLSVQTAGKVKIRFHSSDGQDVCMVSVAPAAKAVFAKPDGGPKPSEFWVRVGNQTKQLHGDELVEYSDDHWN
ncbi:MAG: DUF262 domain-containing protein [Chloroflexota bacterium]|nr:DUF262 domain-containing protein [Chloroflexota bacterium]